MTRQVIGNTKANGTQVMAQAQQCTLRGQAVDLMS